MPEPSAGPITPWLWAGALALAVGGVVFVYARGKPPDRAAAALPSTSAPIDDAPTELPRPRADEQTPRPLRSVAVDDDRADTAFVREMRKRLKEDPAAVRRELDAKLAKAPKDEKLLAERAWLHLEESEFKEARELAARCVRVNRDNALCKRARAFAYSREGEMEHRIPIMKACFSAARTDAKCLGSMIHAHLKKGEPREAKDILAELKELAPEGVDMHMAQGRFAETEKRNDDAIRHYDLACELGDEEGCDRLDELSPDP